MITKEAYGHMGASQNIPLTSLFLNLVYFHKEDLVTF